MSSVLEKINYWTAPYMWKKKSAKDMITLWEDVQKPFYNDIPEVSNPDVSASIIHDNRKWEHVEYIRQLRGNFTIDPKSGFLIEPDGQIIQESIIYDHYAVYPEKIKSKAVQKTTRLPEVILYDHYWSQNYFHFYSDIFTKLSLLQNKAPHLKTLPLVVSKRISETRTFRFFMQFAEVAALNWYIQDTNEIIHTESAYLLQPMPYASMHWNWVKQLAEKYLYPYCPEKKIFINRPPATGRHIANFEAIRPVLEDEGFEIAELENKSVPEQIALFSGAGVVASIHGAALANMIYCDPRCKILEVTADECINSHYYWLSKTLKLASYDCLTGGKLETRRMFYPKGRFTLDPDKTRSYLRHMLK